MDYFSPITFSKKLEINVFSEKNSINLNYGNICHNWILIVMSRGLGVCEIDLSHIVMAVSDATLPVMAEIHCHLGC